MRHPYLCALLLALPYVLSLWLGRPIDLLAWAQTAVQAMGGGSASAAALLLAAAVPLGAFLAALPGRLRRTRTGDASPVTPAQCLSCYAGGFFSAIGCLAAGGGFSLLAMSGGMVATLSALAFIAAAAIPACLCAAILERRHAE